MISGFSCRDIAEIFNTANQPVGLHALKKPRETHGACYSARIETHIDHAMGFWRVSSGHFAIRAACCIQSKRWPGLGRCDPKFCQLARQWMRANRIAQRNFEKWRIEVGCAHPGGIWAGSCMRLWLDDPAYSWFKTRAVDLKPASRSRSWLRARVAPPVSAFALHASY